MPVEYQDVDTSNYSTGVLEANSSISSDWRDHSSLKHNLSSTYDAALYGEIPVSLSPWSSTRVNPFRSFSVFRSSLHTLMRMEHDLLVEDGPWRAYPRNVATVKGVRPVGNKHLPREHSKSNKRCIVLTVLVALVLLLSAAGPFGKSLLIQTGQKLVPSGDGRPEGMHPMQPPEGWDRAFHDYFIHQIPTSLKIQVSRAPAALFSLKKILVISGMAEAASLETAELALRGGDLLLFSGSTLAFNSVAFSFGYSTLWGGDPPDVQAVDTGQSFKRSNYAGKFDAWLQSLTEELWEQRVLRWRKSLFVHEESVAPRSAAPSRWPDSDQGADSGSGSRTSSPEVRLYDYQSRRYARLLKGRKRNSDSESSSSSSTSHSGSNVETLLLAPESTNQSLEQKRQRSHSTRRSRRRGTENEGDRHHSKGHRKRYRCRRSHVDSTGHHSHAKPATAFTSEKAFLKDKSKSKKEPHRSPTPPPNSPSHMLPQHGSPFPPEFASDERPTSDTASNFPASVPVMTYSEDNSSSEASMEDDVFIEGNSSSDASGEDDDSTDELEQVSEASTASTAIPVKAGRETRREEDATLSESDSDSVESVGDTEAPEGTAFPPLFAPSASIKLGPRAIEVSGLLMGTDSGAFASGILHQDLPGINSSLKRKAFARSKRAPASSTEALLVAVRQALEGSVSSENDS